MFPFIPLSFGYLGFLLHHEATLRKENTLPMRLLHMMPMREKQCNIQTRNPGSTNVKKTLTCVHELREKTLQESETQLKTHCNLILTILHERRHSSRNYSFTHYANLEIK